MTYEYLCESCGVLTDVIKSVKDIDRVEKCDHCDGVTARQFSFRVHFIGTSVESAEYNPGLGMVIKSKYHRSEEAKKQGLVEIGNEKPKVLRKHYADQRETKRRKSYEDI